MAHLRLLTGGRRP